ncbi:30S ribosomal protein S14 [Mariniluteicoccus flavus]
MAKKSKIARNEQRRATVERYAARRAQLKAVIDAVDTAWDERMTAVRDLSKLPRDASPTRLRNRDAIDGRPRAYIRKAGISRVRFREMAHRGELPGITKSSW